MKERAERASEHRDDGYRVRLKEDVQHARGAEMGFGSWDETVNNCVLVQKTASPRLVISVPLALRSKPRKCSWVGVAPRATLRIS